MTKAEWLDVLEQRHGADLQRKFSSACVAVCGLGGLGSNVAITLARAGIGTLLLIDFDKVDISNLHRQQYSVSQLGMYKTEAMKQILSDISPYCKVITYTVKMTEENLSLIADCSIVCECFDNAQCKAMLVNGVAERYHEKYSADGRFTFIRFEDRGHNYIFCSENSTVYKEEYNAAAAEWLESIGGSENLTEEMRAEYYEENFDKHRGYELDGELMAQMLELYNNSIE